MTPFTDTETALLITTPVVLHEPTYERLFLLGIHGPRAVGYDPTDALGVDEVAFDGARFEFCRDAGYSSPHHVAVIIPARNEAGDVDDLVAWDIDSNSVATWRGRAFMLGAENISAPRGADPLICFETVAEYLRDGRRGAFILDTRRAAEPLCNMTLGVMRETFGRRLHTRLTRAPRVVVAATKRRAVA